MKIGFIGFGNIAQALSAGFVRSAALLPTQIGACARDWAKLRAHTEPQGFNPFGSAAELVAWADVVVVAVKPHQVAEVLTPLREPLAHKIVISVVAGYPFDRY
ncbi:MAG: NAD(P)-binding domain-containing protein, partial [Alistipes sp.]